MNAGFTLLAELPNVWIDLSPSAVNREALTWKAEFTDLIGLLMGRLYYAEESLARLRGHVPEDQLRRCLECPALLALHLYRIHGTQALERLEGDFSLAILDAAAQRLIAVRDPMGGYPLFWTRNDRIFGVGTRLTDLASLRGVPALNRSYLADFLMMPGAREEEPTDQCVYHGVQRVPPGVCLAIDMRSGAVTQEFGIDWLRSASDPGSDRLDQIGDRYLEVMRRAVRERMRGRTWSECSGGMDSTTVTLLAHQSGHPVEPVVRVYERLGQLSKETPYVDCALGMMPGVTAHRFRADDWLQFDSFPDALILDEPYSGLAALPVVQPMIDAAGAGGVATILTGHGADEIHDVQPFHLGGLLRRGRLLKAWREAGRWARYRNGNRWELLRLFGLPAIGWPCLAWRRRPRGLRNLDEQTVPPWIEAAFVREQALWERSAANQRAIFQRQTDTNLSQCLWGLRCRAGAVSNGALAAAKGVAITHPFLDRRVLALGLGIRLRLPAEPGPKKATLVEATRKLLPDPIRLRQVKTGHDELFYLGLSRNLNFLLDMVRAAPIDHLGIFDKAELMRHLEEASFGGANCSQVHHLGSALALIRWLSLAQENLHNDRPRRVKDLQPESLAS